MHSIFFAVSLFGYFELQLPSGLVNRSSNLGSAGGYLGALFMGLTLTLAAFTCTVQFVGGVLVWAANGEWLWPILGMISFSTAFAAPFVLLALFPQYLAAMPRSGGWLHHTKVVLAFIEVGAARVPPHHPRPSRPEDLDCAQVGWPIHDHHVVRLNQAARKQVEALL